MSALADVCFDANSGAYMCRRPPPWTGSATAIPRGQQRCRGPSRRPQPDKKEFRHQRCRLCNHDHVFETRSGLNSHSVLQHGKYYSINLDGFVPIPECDLVAAQERAKRARQHRTGQSVDATVGVVTPRRIALSPTLPVSTTAHDFVRAANAARRLRWMLPSLPTVREERGSAAVDHELATEPEPRRTSHPGPKRMSPLAQRRRVATPTTLGHW